MKNKKATLKEAIKLHPDLFAGDDTEKENFIKNFSAANLSKESSFWNLKVGQKVFYKQTDGKKIPAICIGFEPNGQPGRAAVFNTKNGIIEVDALINGKSILKENIKKANSKIIKEAPETTEAESNSKTSILQTCVEESANLKNSLEEFISNTLDSNDSDLLNLMKSQVDFISNSLNKLVAIETSEEVVNEADNPSVNMTVDSVVKNPEDVKKLGDKKIDVNLTDDDGTSLMSEAPVPISNQNVIFYIVEMGESRGNDFSGKVKLTLSQINRALQNSVDGNDFFEKMPEEFFNLFYNTDYTEANYKKSVKKLLNTVIKKGFYVETWEEGTTGIGLNYKDIKRRVKEKEDEINGNEYDDEEMYEAKEFRKKVTKEVIKKLKENDLLNEEAIQKFKFLKEERWLYSGYIL